MEGRRFVLQGECNRCGDCCLNEECDWLSFSGDKAICAVHGTDLMPDKCSLFPYQPPITMKRCSYTFLDNDTGDIFGVGEMI